MFDSQVLDVVVGLVFIYLLLSFICTAANEMIAALFALRARNLAKGISNLLADKRIRGLDELFYEHPLIRGLSRGNKKPSYIPAHAFALALLDGIAPFKEDGAEAMAEIRAAVNGQSSDSELRRVLQIFLQQAGDDFAKFTDNIENWYNDSMARILGWYKRKSQLITLVLAIIVAGLTNADTLQIVQNLSVDAGLRAVVASQAQQWIEQRLEPETAVDQPEEIPGSTGTPSSVDDEDDTVPSQLPPKILPNSEATMKVDLGELQQTGIQLGWQTMPKKEEWGAKAVGLLLTIFVISLGAPFWFDILNRISKIRSTGKNVETTVKEKSKKNPE